MLMTNVLVSKEFSNTLSDELQRFYGKFYQAGDHVNFTRMTLMPSNVALIEALMIAAEVHCDEGNKILRKIENANMEELSELSYQLWRAMRFHGHMTKKERYHSRVKAEELLWSK